MSYIEEVYAEQGIEDGGTLIGGQLFVDTVNQFEYIFKKDGLIYEHVTDGRITKRYQMNLQVKTRTGHTKRVLIKGLARQMKFALPRILKRREYA